MAMIRLVIGGVVAVAGAGVALLALAREWLADPLGLDWLDASQVDQQFLGGDVSNVALFFIGFVVFSLGAWVAGKTDEWS